MTTWKLTVEYEGTKFSGWQEQQDVRTVQGVLRRAIADVLGEPADLQAAGRTDAGVHAAGQVVHARWNRSVPRRKPAQALDLLNQALPADVAVLDAAEVPPSFHARHDAVARAYLYQISLRKTAFGKRHVWWIKQPLDVDAMSLAAAKITRRHDFRQFGQYDSARPDESTVVVVHHAEVIRDEHLVIFRIEASHFIWKMVRRLVGALARIGTGELAAADFERLLRGIPVDGADVPAWTAPASGLFLEAVKYRERP